MALFFANAAASALDASRGWQKEVIISGDTSYALARQQYGHFYCLPQLILLSPLQGASMALVSVLKSGLVGSDSTFLVLLSLGWSLKGVPVVLQGS